MTSDDFVAIFYSNYSPNLEKYLSLLSTKKMLILPYPHSEDAKVFEFTANPRFFVYIKHKQKFLNQRNAKLR